MTAPAVLQALPEWARKTLQKHASDQRPHLKTDEQLETGTTGDAMWDACQHQLVVTGQLKSVPPSWAGPQRVCPRWSHHLPCPCLPAPCTDALGALPTI